MEAGYDYLLLRGSPRRSIYKISGIFLFILGAMLLATSGAYYGYAAKARADLDNLNVNLSGAISHQPAAADLPSPVASDLNNVPMGMESGIEGELDLRGPNGRPREVPAAGVNSGVAPDILEFTSAASQGSARFGMAPFSIGSQRLYPGAALAANSWSNPLAYEPAYFREQALLRGFTAIDIDRAQNVGSEIPATRIIIPSIDVDSTIRELSILDLGGSRAYETPANTVGHIPETANAGEANSSWFFGHTESLTLGEGSVFFNLREIPEMLRRGEDVHIIIDNGERRYLYRVTSSQVVPQNEMRLYETGKATIHLVSCLPRLVYDHRLIVSGELVATG